jgi:hypothetical protein
LAGTVPGVGLAMAAVRASRRRDDRPSCNLCQPMVSRRRHPGVMWNSPRRGPRWFTQRGLICGNSLRAGSSWMVIPDGRAKPVVEPLTTGTQVGGAGANRRSSFEVASHPAPCSVPEQPQPPCLACTVNCCPGGPSCRGPGQKPRLIATLARGHDGGGGTAPICRSRPELAKHRMARLAARCKT